METGAKVAGLLCAGSSMLHPMHPAKMGPAYWTPTRKIVTTTGGGYTLEKLFH